jgi:uncharacterized protein YoxC
VTSDSLNWSIILYVGVGLGVLLAGVGILFACVRLGNTFLRLHRTLDEVERQLGTLSVPVAQTLSHVGGIADTADVTLAKLSGVVGQIEKVAGSVARTSTLAQDALAPSIVNLGSTVSGVTAGLRRLARGKDRPPSD